MTFNVGVIIGPILGGVLSDPAGSYPGLFGNIDFFKRFRYATPNLVSAVFLLMAILGVWLCLEEASALNEIGFPFPSAYLADSDTDPGLTFGQA
jgi:MFS family permease